MFDNLSPFAVLSLCFVGPPLLALAVYIFVRVASAAYFKSRNQFNQQEKG